MDTSAGGLSAVGLAVVLGLSVISCGGEDAGAEPDAANGEPSAGETGSEDGSSDPEEPSGEGGAAEDPESSPTPVPASSDGPAENWPEPEVPDEIYEETEEGALAALRYWFEAINYLQMTGDSGPVESVTGSECEVCLSRIDRYLDLYINEEGWYRADGTAAEDEISTVLEGGETVAILFHIEDGEFEVFDASGESQGVTPPRTYENAEATVGYEDGVWTLQELVVREAEQ
ncbi:DUF6318 family protein [Nesterenkonia sp. Act20]|uniref:DUF6318 family protein n=1 Tax=Nesterenkonia sp. Act20 TaxID=1483432 RepID=UPI001C47943A|nr:DUF6318 family protein [Nesterenkonia sp. Act20]